MYLCSTCYSTFRTKEELAKHSLICWKEQHPYHKSKNAPQSESITIEENKDNMLNFLKNFG